MDMWSLGQIVYEMHANGTMFASADDAFARLTDGDLDVATGFDGMRQIPQDERLKIERIEDRGAREVITGLLQIQPERRVDSEAVRNLYLDGKE
jgi:serine/threonine protein kinase